MGADASASVHVCYLGDVRRAIGTADERVRFDAPLTLGALLDRLVERHGTPLRDQLFEGCELSRGTSVLIDGRNCRTLGGLEASLDGASELEVVVFGPPITGG